jgi:hypothetical protein
MPSETSKENASVSQDGKTMTVASGPVSATQDVKIAMALPMETVWHVSIMHLAPLVSVRKSGLDPTVATTRLPVTHFATDVTALVQTNASTAFGTLIRMKPRLACVTKCGSTEMAYATSPTLLVIYHVRTVQLERLMNARSASKDTGLPIIRCVSVATWIVELAMTNLNVFHVMTASI